MGATTTSKAHLDGNTNFIGVEGQLIDDVLDESLGLGQSIVALPVASYKESTH